MNAVLLLAMTAPNANAGLIVGGPQLDCEWNPILKQIECHPVNQDNKPDDDDWGIQTAEVEGDSNMPTFLLAAPRGDSEGGLYVLMEGSRDAGIYGQVLADVPMDLKSWKASEEDVNRDGMDDLVVDLDSEILVWLGDFKDVASWNKPDEVW